MGGAVGGVTTTEQARRSDALYNDNVSMHRRDLCDMVAHREADIEDLRALAHDMLLSLEWTMRGNSVHVRQFLAYKRMARKLGVKE